MALEPGQIRKEVAAYMAAVHNADAHDLSIFGPPSEEEEFKERLDRLFEIEEEERREYITENLRLLIAQEDFTGLSEIHPAWLVEVLSKESPRIIGIILRYLPSKQVRYIIEHLPKRIKHRLPQLIDSFAVPSPILKIVRGRFERQFMSSGSINCGDDFGFEHISHLKSKDLETLFKDIGIHELAMSLKGVDRRSLNILFNRLSVDEARSLQQRIRSLVDIPASFLKEAKYTVLEMSLTEADPNELLLDVGLNAFARALTEDDLYMFPVIKQKLEPRLSYMLKRYIDQHMASNTDEAAGKRKELIFGRVVALARAGSIDETYARFFVAGEKTQAIELPPVEGPNKASASEGAKQPDGWQQPIVVV